MSSESECVIALMRSARSMIRTLSPEPDVIDLACRRGVVHQPLERADAVGDMAKTSSLRAVPVNLDGLARKRAMDEARNDHSILAALARTYRVEQSTITQSRPRSWWYASVRNSSIAFESAYAQRRAVVGP